MLFGKQIFSRILEERKRGKRRRKRGNEGRRAQHTRAGAPLAPVRVKMEAGWELKKGKPARCADTGVAF